ncbi:acyltransferase [Bradyrhizobium sp. AUGA SZCCT0177]|uniref:acyltransferase family protein n=1 Tax=Bradyrhizobium sp. AUGA SZCCT0177 TaxID=2807665 RepID=UPI001BA6AE12|nr:acyltransferase [Bradyrhizobium sp. AUGA SZCCT0177]MBR1280899.1 acyltransferase [Bradyrhizobium sp. AUGA SZCCT0177]
MALPFPYNPALDGLRAVAVLLVIADHCDVTVFDQGYFGVDLFFVLSGFLITRLLVDEIDATGRIDLRRFYLRRLLRLTPPLLLLLAAYLLIAPLLWPQLDLMSHVRDAALVAFYLSDYSQAFWHNPKVLIHTWSLSVEEHFYLIWPFAVLLLARIGPRGRVVVLFGLYVLASAWRIYIYKTLGWDATYYRFDTRIDGLVCGALLATALRHKDLISERAANIAGVVAWAALTVCLSIGFWRAPWSLVIMTNVAHIAAFGLLISVSKKESRVSLVLSAPPLVGIGVISYGMYLWHYPAAIYFRELFPWYLTGPIVLGFSIAMATVSYLAVERPLQRYRRSLGGYQRNAATKPASVGGAQVPQTAIGATTT